MHFIVKVNYYDLEYFNSFIDENEKNKNIYFFVI